MSTAQIKTPLQHAYLELIDTDARALIKAERDLWLAVETARDHGRLTWAEIALVLGVTRSAAQQRFSKPPRGQLV